MAFYNLRNIIRTFSLILKGSSYTNAKTLVNSRQYNKDIAKLCCNLPFDSFASRVFSTYDGIKYTLGEEFNHYYIRNLSADSEIFHGFIAICTNQKKYLIYDPKNILIDLKQKKEIYILLHKIRQRFNSTPFLDMSLTYVNKDLKIVKINCGTNVLCDEGIYEFLREKNVNLSYSEKNFRSSKDRISWLFVNVINYIGRKKGFLGFMYRNWLNGCMNDYKENSIKNFCKIHQAHKKGFFFYHVNQYGLTKENYRKYLSDYDYKKLRPIDGDVWRILWDKPSLQYVFESYKEYLPKHYAIIRKRYVNNIKKNEAYFFNENNLEKAKIENLIELIKEKHIVAAKPFVGSHGIGFYKLEYRLGTFYINGRDCSYEKLKNFFSDLDDSYVITEYINMSNQFKEIYSHAVSTLRLMVIKECGKAKVVNAFARFATKNGGSTDNISKGGIAGTIDILSGIILKAEMLINHNFSEIESHPDTGANLLIEIENWNQIVEKVCEISNFLKPFTYLGFDIALTEDGFKIIEINTHQDLHKYNEYSSVIKKFLEEKCVKRDNVNNLMNNA